MATMTQKCPNCGGGLRFDPASQKSRCEFCQSEFSIGELEKARDEGAADRTAADSADHLVGYVCDSCGAQVVTEDTTSATFCYFCHNPILLTNRLSGDFRPDRIIPFRYDRDKAIRTFLDWSRTKRFVPPGFYSASQLEKITGLYLPFWMADYEAEVDYAGKGVVRKVWISGSMEYTEHKEYEIERQGTISVAHLHEPALRRIDRDLVDSIAPFDSSQAVDFSLSYLSGFFAESFDIGRDEVVPTLEERARSYVAALLRDSIQGYGQVTETRNTVRMTPRSWHYTLFPVWILTYRYEGKTYVYAVNGQNGRAYGELPVYKAKLNLVSGLVAAGLLALLLLGGRFLW